MGRNLLVFLCFLMLTELVIENISICKTSVRVKKLESEIINLKAKLYDRLQDEEDDEEIEDEDAQP